METCNTDQNKKQMHINAQIVNFEKNVSAVPGASTKCNRFVCNKLQFPLTLVRMSL